MNECEAKKENNKPTGIIMIENEEKVPEHRLHNIELLKTFRAFLIHAPPILTKSLKLGNLRRNSNDDFVFSDFDNYMGNLFTWLSYFRFPIQR
jgi:hypothetical protein